MMMMMTHWTQVRHHGTTRVSLHCFFASKVVTAVLAFNFSTSVEWLPAPHACLQLCPSIQPLCKCAGDAEGLVIWGCISVQALCAPGLVLCLAVATDCCVLCCAVLCFEQTSRPRPSVVRPRS